MARPTARLEISFTPPADAPAWDDESDYLIRFSIDRGRSNELDRQNAGTANLVLINTDGRFDPVNASGAHYPDVLPMRRVKLSTDVASGVAPFTLRSSTIRGTTQTVLRGGTSTFALFTGFVESWSQTWALGNGDAAVTVRCVDAFKIFNLTKFVWGHRYLNAGANPEDWICGLASGSVAPDTGTPRPPDELTGLRITRVLDCAGWPEEDRLLDAGTVTLWGSNVSDAGNTNFKVTANALSELVDSAATDGGYLFMDTSGRVKFIDADHVPTLDTTDVYGGLTGEIHFFDIAAPFDDDRLWNSVTVTTRQASLSGSLGASEDATSIAEFYKRELTVTLLPANNLELTARADALLARYKDPHLRIEQLELAPNTEDEWRRILMRELADVVLVRKRPAGADEISRELRIEGIHIEAPGGTDWRVTWQLSDVAVGSVAPGEGEFGWGEFGGGTFELLGVAPGGEGFDSGGFDSATFGA